MAEATCKNDEAMREDSGEASSEHDSVPSSEHEDDISPDDDDDADGEDDEAVYEAVTACLGLFSNFKEQTGSLDTSIKLEEHVDEHVSDIANFMEDMGRSFNIWIDYTGALAADVSRSLDARLQGYKDIKDMAIEMLEMLARNIEYLVAKTAQDGSKDPSNSDLQQEAVDSIRHSIEELHFIASVIRKSSVRSQTYSLSSGFEKDDEQYFEGYVFQIIRHTFPHARRSLCKQLGTSIALRRKRLRRKIQHEGKLKNRRKPTNRGQSGPAVQGQTSQPQPGTAARSAPSPRPAGNRVIPSGSVGTRSNLNAGMARRGLKAGPRPPLSAVSMGSSVRLSTRKYPPKPPFPPGATDCACPYCARRLPIAKLRNVPTFWDDHLDEDVEPYVCLSEECTSPLLFFVHMKQWVDHMTSVHSEQWFRRIHMSTWYCNTKHEAEQFNDLESFMEHMKDSARHPGQPPPSDLQLDTLSRNRQKTLTREDKYSCPFCDCIPSAIKPVVSTSEAEAIQLQLYKHIASHLKNLAVLSVPVLTTLETPETESEESEDNERGRRLKDDEKASYPSGYDEEIRAIPLADDDNPIRPPLDVPETHNTAWYDNQFLKWHESEGPRTKRPESERDVVLEDLIRGQGVASANSVSTPTSPTRTGSVNEDYMVAWLCNRTVDLVAAQAFLDEKHGKPHQLQPNDSNTYSLGRIRDHNVVIVANGEYDIGRAEIIAAQALLSFPNIRVVLRVGIAGGAPSPKHDVRLGDVVVGVSGVIRLDRTSPTSSSRPPRQLMSSVKFQKAEYEMNGNGLDKAIQGVLQRHPRLRAKYSRPDPSSDRLYASDFVHVQPIDHGDSGCEQICGDSNLIARRERSEDEDNPAIHYGSIASLDLILKDATSRDRLSAEMGVLGFSVDLISQLPCLVICGICNYCDSHGDSRWQGYAAMAAAAYAKDIFCHVMPDAVGAEPKLRDTVSEIQESVRRVVSRHDRTENINILDWLTPLDFGPQQSDFRARRQPGTGDWFLQSPEFHNWLEGKGQTLFCPGIPGAGKTVITSIVVDDLHHRYQDDRSTAVAYIYCMYQRSETQRLEDLISSLLQQMVRAQQSIPESVRRLYDIHKSRRTRPTVFEVSRTLQSVALTYSRAFILVDAVDEVPEDARRQLLHELFTLREICGVNILATSRPHMEIRREFDNSLVLEIHATDEDLSNYLNSEMSRLPNFIQRNSQLQEEIIPQIIRSVGGMFFLAVIYLRLISSMNTARGVRKLLQDIQSRSGQQQLHYFYDQAMDRIMNQKSGEKALAIQVLGWIATAKRPLTTLELQHALAVEPGDVELDGNNLIDIENLGSVCVGLLSIDHESGLFRLVHYTVHDYLDRTRDIWFPDAESSVTAVCTRYLSFDTFQDGVCGTDEEFEARLHSNPFYDYAARNWGYHARHASVDTLHQDVMPFLRDEAKVEASSQVLMADREYREQLGYSQRAPRLVTGLHLAGYFGVIEAAGILLTTGLDIDRRSSDGRTALCYAAMNGHEAIVRLLLDNGANLSIQDQRGSTCLLLAAANGHTAVVDCLLDAGADINVANDKGLSPLLITAAKGHIDIAKLLLERGANVNFCDPKGSTPLLLVAANGFEEFVRLLLDNGALIDLRDQNGSTPLRLAAANGHAAVVELLVQRGADTNSYDMTGQTPLEVASANGHEDVVQILLATGRVDIDLTDSHGRTALSVASKNLEEQDEQVSTGPTLPESREAESQFTHEDYTIGWICGSPVEVDAATACLDVRHEDIGVIPGDSNYYILGQISGHNIVIACPPAARFGLAASATLAANMLRSFPQVRFGVLVGVGSGVPSTAHDIRLGDVVVSQPQGSHGGVIQYDAGKRLQNQPFQIMGSLNRPPRALLAAAASLKTETEIRGLGIEDDIKSILEKYPRMRDCFSRPEPSTDKLYVPSYAHVADGPCENGCDPQYLVARRQRDEDDDNPTAHYGLIASGDMVIKDASFRDVMAQESDVLCFEMEAAGLMNDFPCIVIRGICDYSDSHKNKIWQGYAAISAAVYARALLRQLPTQHTTWPVQPSGLSFAPEER